MKKLKIPKFATEAQEADWWDRHMDVVEANLIEAMQNGTAHRGGPLAVIRERREAKAREAAREAKNITIRLAVTDIERARTLAAKKGIGYQTLIKMILKEGLDRQYQKLRPTRKKAS